MSEREEKEADSSFWIFHSQTMEFLIIIFGNLRVSNTLRLATEADIIDLVFILS